MMLDRARFSNSNMSHERERRTMIDWGNNTSRLTRRRVDASRSDLIRERTHHDLILRQS